MSIIRIVRIVVGISLSVGAVLLIVFGFQTLVNPPQGADGAFSVMMALTLFGVGILAGLLGYAALKALPGYLKKKKPVIPEKPAIFSSDIDKAL